MYVPHLGFGTSVADKVVLCERNVHYLRNLELSLQVFFYCIGAKPKLNDLLACYNAYERLLNTQYRFVVGRKGKEYRISITFQWEDFFHLTGIQHLTDLSLSPKSKARAVFRSKIKAGEITMQDLLKSKFCVTNNIDIPCRIKYLSFLDLFIASENNVLEYLNKSDKGSHITADWMIKGEINTQECYLFIEAHNSRTRANNSRQKSEYFCKTFFPFQGITYGSYAASTTILLKERLNLVANTTETLYRHPKFSKNFDLHPYTENNQRL